MSTAKFKETEIGMIPEDWEVREVWEIGEVKTGKTPPTKNKNFFKGEYPFIKIPDMTEGFYIKSTDETLSEDGKNHMKSLMLPKNSVCVSCLATIGNVGITTKDSFTNQQINSIIPNEKVDNVFVYYYFKNKKEYLKNMSGGGSVYNNLSKSKFQKLKIILPPLSEQKSIAKILSDLDEKIEVNRQMNEILEELGQTLFKRWFVDFEFPNEKGKPYRSSGGRMVKSELGEIPEGWKVEEFDSLFELTMGLSPKGESYNSDREGIPLLNGAADFNEDVIYPTKHTTQPTRVNKERDLIFCIRGTIGNIVLADKQYCLGRGVAAITSKSENFDEFIYFKLHEKIEELIQNASGSVIIGLSKEDIAKQKVICAPLKILETFHKQMKTIFSKKRLNSQDKDNLIQIRDALLPKLMTGKIRVNL